jgi:hypothetical protein
MLKFLSAALRRFGAFAAPGPVPELSDSYIDNEEFVIRRAFGAAREP